MNPSNLKAAIGVGALAGAMFLTGIGAPTLPGAFAQETAPATPSAVTDGAGSAATTNPRLQAMTEHYETFLGKMAGELGATDEEVDAAIRASLKGMIDDAVAAGDLAANDATALKERIDDAEIPVLGIMGRGFGDHDGRGGHWDGGKHRGRGERGDRGRWDESRDAETRPEEADDADDASAEQQATNGGSIDAIAPLI